MARDGCAGKSDPLHLYSYTSMKATASEGEPISESIESKNRVPRYTIPECTYLSVYRPTIVISLRFTSRCGSVLKKKTIRLQRLHNAYTRARSPREAARTQRIMDSGQIKIKSVTAAIVGRAQLSYKVTAAVWSVRRRSNICALQGHVHHLAEKKSDL